MPIQTSKVSTYLLFTLFIAIILFSISSCKVDKYDDTLGFAYEYQPLAVGQYTIYDIDSIDYNFLPPNAQVADTIRYQLKELITDTFYDNQNRLNYRLELFTRTDTAPSWVFWKVWYCLKTDRTFERQEDDLRFMKLVFPIRNDINWNGNIFLPVSDTSYLKLYYGWNYIYKNLGLPSTVNGITFNETVEVSHVNDENLIDKRMSREIYAKGVGLIFRQFEKIEKQDVAASWDNPYKADGFRYIKKINSYGP
jgi:hypothetical protein